MEKCTYTPQNGETEILLRRYNDAFAICGIAVIVFSLWDILKMFVGFFLGEETFDKIIAETLSTIEIPEEVSAETVRLVVWAVMIGVILILSAIVFLFHLYIGLNAFREGRGIRKKKSKTYLVLAALVLVFSGALMVSSVVIFFGQENHGGVRLASLLLEFTSFFNYAYLMYSAYKIHCLKRGAI
ncbi:hypothetical protein ACTQ56_09960 [[Clostridium] aminophilum]|uniref:hypothetical protein n=1 Tax=[Clostridium] aminophilum TaxID=1526 RepID=UPI0026EE46FD|nr:hypothetical protein [[Clostridium] aminophilum]MDD6196386.1 hypothetical protein [[Clostridium] aminophilum]